MGKKISLFDTKGIEKNIYKGLTTLIKLSPAGTDTPV